MEKNILILHDDYDVLKNVCEGLIESGYNVDSVSNRNEAIAKARQNKYSAVMIEYTPYKMDCYQSYLSFSIMYPDLRVIIITKNVEENVMKDIFPGETICYLDKKSNSANEVSTFL